MDEVRDADVLIHVVDISHVAYQDHISIVNETLNDILKEPKPTIICFNKIDLLSKEDLQAQHNQWRELNNEVVFVSAAKKEGDKHIEK